MRPDPTDQAPAGRHRVVRSRVEVVDADGLAQLCTPRDDVVGEQAVPVETNGPDDGEQVVARFELGDGPFVHYSRVVELLGADQAHELGVLPDGEGDEEGDSHRDASQVVRQTVTFELPAGTWRPLLNRVLAFTLQRPGKPGRMPWWAPPQRPDPRAASVVGLLAALALVVAYHGTLLGQTMTFAADEFGVSNTAQGVALSAARIGGVLAIVLTSMGDRLGRRRMLLTSLVVCIGSTMLGAVSPNLVGLTVTQLATRGGWAASIILLGIILSEEMPAGARAYAISVVSLTGALGAGMALWVLPVADVGVRAWRILYLVPLVLLPIVVYCGRRLPESRRYERPHRNLSLSLGGHRGRLWLLAGAALLLNVFLAPQTQLRNEFLRDHRGFSAAAVSLFVMVVSTPAGIGVVAGGRLSDTVGRRLVGAVSVVLGTGMIAVSFSTGGPPMWLLALLGSVVFAAHIPALSVYGPELFPTSLRGRANGVISITAMGGSVVGLLAAGALADAFGTYGPTMAIMAVGPLGMGALILLRFPETAKRELEDINPEDRDVPPVLSRELS